MNHIAGVVTIGIPTYNRRAYLTRAVESVLAQTFRALEVVVSDNKSTDDTLEQLQKISDPRLRILRQSRNIGMVGNFNACLEAASGELFLMLSDDDLLEETAVEHLSLPLLDPGKAGAPGVVGMAWCPSVILNAQGKDLWPTAGGPKFESPASLLAELFSGRRGCRFSSVMIRTADCLRAGGYDEARYGAICDNANWGRVALQYPWIACIQEPLVKYTVHAKSETSHSTVKDWQHWGENMHADLVSASHSHTNSEDFDKLLKVRKGLLANLTATVMLQSVGQPGWIRKSVQEFWRSREFLLTPLVFKRMLREGWKMLRLRR